jgi:Cys-tRNA(Pro)/Cys-tRNA(Cys) deacylase
MSRSTTPKNTSTSTSRKGAASGGTPATVALERAGVQFGVRSFDNDIAPGELGYGKAAAAALGVSEQRVFKTLLVEATGPVRHAVAIVPVSGQLSLKAMAAAIGAKKADMLEARTAERLTGYVVGGISPFGQKKSLPTVVDASALDHETIFVSGGKRGLDVEIAPHALLTVLGAVSAAISA